MSYSKMTFVALALAFAGCISAPVCFVPSSIPVEPGHYKVLADEASGTSVQFDWLFFTFGWHGSGQRRALDYALGKDDADALVGMAVDRERFVLIPFLLPTIYKIRVTGTPIKITK